MFIEKNAKFGPICKLEHWQLKISCTVRVNAKYKQYLNYGNKATMAVYNICPWYSSYLRNLGIYNLRYISI